jgi:subtilisin family serine protease
VADIRVGLVDSGVDSRHPALRGAGIRSWGCNAPHPDAHGTAVAALMVGRDGRFRGALPGAQLYAADIYCANPAGGSAGQIAAALGWLAREQVGVINLSLVGPSNQALERMVAAMVARGHLLVAAVGNDGPAAPPLYPASYPGVVGVTAVDRQGQPLPEAARGPQVQFAAPGNNMVSASLGEPAYRPVRGTSYAAPLVAGLLAPALPRPDRQQARDAVAKLARRAGGDSATVSNVLGHGIVGADLRIDPARLR